MLPRLALLLVFFQRRTSALSFVLAGAAIVYLVGIDWGLPASDTWDNDGVAPRDFLPGLVDTFTPGRYFTYPPLHLALIGLATLPVSIVALAKAPSFVTSDVIGEFIRVPYMTIDAVVSRLLSAAMAVGIVASAAAIARELAGRRAEVVSALVVATNSVLVYYAHTTNLDVPYLFWSLLALAQLVRALCRDEPRRLRAVGLFAACAITTKDQAYALFGLTLPLLVGAWAWQGRERARAVLREAAVAAAVGAGLVLVIDGALFNPRGFAARLDFLAGHASQDYANYAASWYGRLKVLRDAVLAFPRYYPVLLAPFLVLGLARVASAWRASDRRHALAWIVVPLAALSFTVLFNFAARRTEERFVLPQMILCGVLAGLGIDQFVERLGARKRIFAWTLAGAVIAWSAFLCLGVDAHFITDPRYAAEAWLDAHVAPGDVIVVHGHNVYLPRLPAAARAIRLGVEPVRARGPLPELEEVEGPLSEAVSLAPRFIVFGDGWAWRFRPETGAGAGDAAPVVRAVWADEASTAYLRDLLEGRLGYRLVFRASFASPIWRRLDIHKSIGQDCFILERS
ncbi:MAG TPA: glycosyltransferase family 39 protein [Polyangiaceae bacterium]|nr:glycosyltransferase family 39 protein [Polyangiaceae bacterium]